MLRRQGITPISIRHTNLNSTKDNISRFVIGDSGRKGIVLHSLEPQVCPRKAVLQDDDEKLWANLRGIVSIVLCKVVYPRPW